MKQFFALPALLRTTALLASASQQSFSVQDDLLAFPQYEIRFADEWMSEHDAQSKLMRPEQTHVNRQTDSDGLNEAPPSHVQQYQQQLRGAADSSGKHAEQVEYERMVLDGQPWLCRVPVVRKPAEHVGVNETLSKAEEERELARATDRGWELLSGMQGNCVFFISGWWSYRFCYNQGVKQFHQLPPSRGVPVYPPMEDPGVPGFMLGAYDKQLEHDETRLEDKWEGESALDMSEGATGKRNGHGELIQRGESRYLVQKLGGGTVCDLTGKERRIEVQFHCNPQSADRISLIKETSTCAYLMVIQTPRLCNDVAFLPPQKDQPNTVSCSPIVRDDEVEEFERDMEAAKAAESDAKVWEATAEAAAAMGASDYDPVELPVGDIFVGGHMLVPEGTKLEKSAIVGGGKETYIDTVASSDGKTLDKEALEKLGLGDAKAVEKLKRDVEKIAQGQQWKLDIIDTPRGREYRVIIGDDEDEGKEKKEEKAAEKTPKTKEGEKVESSREKRNGKNGEDGQKKNKKEQKSREKRNGKNGEDGQKKNKKEQKGSEEEYYKEEL